MSQRNQKIGWITATALVVGNMIGSGIFVLPATLASYGSISLLGWLFTAAGALVLAKIFSNFSQMVTNKSGGPYRFTQEGLGDFMAFLVGWGYWISCWVVNAAIAVAVVSAMTVFIPELATQKWLSVGIGLGCIWLFTGLNSMGVKTSGRIQLVTTILKILPLLFIILVGAFYFSLDNFPEFNTSEATTFDAFSAVAALTLFAFLGLESATIPSENIENAKTVVPKATLWGTLITTFIYVLGTVVLFGVLPIEVLQQSPAPFAEAADIMGGQWAAYFVGAGAAIAAIGALNGWILMMGQVSRAAARDHVFPKIFMRDNERGVPVSGLIIGSLLSSIIMWMNFTESLVDQFAFMVLLTTLCTLVPYLFTAVSYVLTMLRDKQGKQLKLSGILLAALGFGYSFWAIYGSGQEAVFYGLLLLVGGIPFYVWMKGKQSE